MALKDIAWFLSGVRCGERHHQQSFLQKSNQQIPPKKFQNYFIIHIFHHTSTPFCITIFNTLKFFTVLGLLWWLEFLVA